MALDIVKEKRYYLCTFWTGSGWFVRLRFWFVWMLCVRRCCVSECMVLFHCLCRSVLWCVVVMDQFELCVACVCICETAVICFLQVFFSILPLLWCRLWLYNVRFWPRVCWIEAKNLVAWGRKWRKPCYWIWMKDDARMNLDSDWWLGHDSLFTWSGLFFGHYHLDKNNK